MTDSASLLKQLDESISQGSNDSRLRALWHATDVLISGQYSEQDIWTFGEVIERLTHGIEAAARTELARRLAHSGNAPTNCINQLARDPSIDIAGPILRHSARLDVATQISIARSKSQPHLLAISKRETVTKPVTDVLVVTGDQDVIASLAGNAGARRWLPWQICGGASHLAAARRQWQGRVTRTEIELGTDKRCRNRYETGRDP